MIALACLALALDLVFADPKSLPHPVQGIGFLAGRLETHARRLGAARGAPVLAGALACLALCLLSASLAALACRLPSFLGSLAALYLAWSGLALGGLVREGKSALARIRDAEKDSSTLPAARHAVQMLVSRDTSAMLTDELYRSLAESLSENLNDAFVAPFFWLCLTGPAGLWFHKTASTLDSMWGYRNERWRDFGKTAARLDDALAFIPARLSAALMLLTAWLEHTARRIRGLPPRPLTPAFDGDFFQTPGWPGYATISRQARACSSPNAGWPMAAAAWLFHGKSGGPTPYDGIMAQKPLLGPEKGRWQRENCRLLLLHVRNTGIVCALIALAFAGIV
ncbi:MAG: cobalamin biosynthesis protein [Desulfovibrio sp.]|jgi:adenosylcobinamide-phosphate synthase|nr:cobalamin biosynthesis protein [Desulfovibrio sp.]